MKVYLASPFFNYVELQYVEEVEKILSDKGLEVFSPRLNEDRNEDTRQQSWWSKQTFENDVKHIDWADCVVMLYHGGYSDSGTAWECGYAYATGKPVIVVHLGKDSNLMIHEGCHSNIKLEELLDYDFNVLPKKEYKGTMF